MKNLHTLDAWRFKAPELLQLYGTFGDGAFGMFHLPSPIDSKPLRVFATVGEGWDHVSVSRKNRCPNWPEMEFIKRRFFEDDETAMQLHVPATDHINHHPYCLHLWRPLDVEIPRPHSDFVGAPNIRNADAIDHFNRLKALSP